MKNIWYAIAVSVLVLIPSISVALADQPSVESIRRNDSLAVRKYVDELFEESSDCYSVYQTDTYMETVLDCIYELGLVSEVRVPEISFYSVQWRKYSISDTSHASRPLIVDVVPLSGVIVCDRIGNQMIELIGKTAAARNYNQFVKLLRIDLAEQTKRRSEFLATIKMIEDSHDEILMLVIPKYELWLRLVYDKLWWQADYIHNDITLREVVTHELVVNRSRSARNLGAELSRRWKRAREVFHRNRTRLGVYRSKQNWEWRHWSIENAVMRLNTVTLYNDGTISEKFTEYRIGKD